MSGHVQQLQDELVAVDVQLEELKRPVIEPPQLGQYKSIVCGKCHIRGHRAEGNRHNAACMREVCTSFYTCGQNKKHPEHFEQIRNLTKKQKQLNSEIETLNTNKSSLEAFQSKSVSAFVTAVTPRLLKAFPDKYNTTTTSGKILLQKDLATLRIACNNKIPSPSADERQYFTELLDKQQKQVFASDLKYNPRVASSSHINIVDTHISSPVSKKAKRHKAKIMSVEISSSDDNSTDSSDITSEDSELFDEEKRPKSRRRRKYRRKYTRHDHWSKKKRFERSQKVSHEYIGENLKIDNSREKQTVTVNQSTIANTRGLMKYSTLDGAIPSDSGIFEIDMSSSRQPEHAIKTTKKCMQAEQKFVTGCSTLTLDDLANAAGEIDNRPCIPID